MLPLAIITGIGVYTVTAWHYEKVQDGLKQEIKVVYARLAVKDDQLRGKDDILTDLRLRLNILAPKGGELSQLTNSELKARTLEFVAGLRKWRASRVQEEGRERDRSMSKLFMSKDMNEWKQISGADNEASMKSSREDMLEYDDKFKVAAILLRDEILSRLLRERRSETASPRFRYLDYESPHDLTWGVAYVADSLERLTKSLG
jgi:hypothetical protein